MTNAIPVTGVCWARPRSRQSSSPVQLVRRRQGSGRAAFRAVATVSVAAIAVLAVAAPVVYLA